MRKVFEKFDHDASGTISADELRAMLRDLDIKMAQAEVQKILNDADVDGTGLIDFDEFVSIVEKELEGGAGAFATMYSRASGFASFLNQDFADIFGRTGWHSENLLAIFLDSMFPDSCY